MFSMFEPVDKEMQGNYSFWKPLLTPNSSNLFSGELDEVSKTGSVKTSNYILTENSLIKETQATKKIVPLQWKRVEPFIEESPSETRCGFRLGHKTCHRDFYVKDVSSLDTWLEYLSSVCIMTDIEDDFTFIKEIGKGNFATVLLATANETAKQFAIKSIKKEKINGSKDTILALINEIKIMRKLEHPNILKLYKVYESESHVYLVLEYVDGGCLYTRIISKKTLPEEAVAKFGYKLLQVLKYLESNNIAHRDIKLENILMVSKDNDYEFKLADFGLATAVTNNLVKRCGSPGYVAPEILRKCSYGIKVDIFSAGVVLYILLSGTMPFVGKSAKEVLLMNSTCVIQYPDRSWKNISREAINLVQNLTETMPDIRPCAADAMEHHWFVSQLRNCRSNRMRSKFSASSLAAMHILTNNELLSHKLLQRDAVTKISGDKNVPKCFDERIAMFPPLACSNQYNSMQMLVKVANKRQI